MPFPLSLSLPYFTIAKKRVVFPPPNMRVLCVCVSMFYLFRDNATLGNFLQQHTKRVRSAHPNLCTQAH